ncbi:B12-binding domain-containing radical SAM protein [Acetobacterium tundrae]|uniref:DUF4080 domain-containing protein n=1 Tax=Acetobacterium tundrae TaxID=132932 RepID=A0ABR6WNB8_9FIRM|nr:B12-binding domain-containing radical SAM protein [Acetobacterium tundrae]MBC3797979.1 DUF4080 domain-containing protein [Acetobacterium tundrae]
MKDLVLVAINAKYIHTNLAVRSLKAQLTQFDVKIIELSINDSLHRIVQHLLATESKIYGFSCYIWNMELILKLAEIVKKARPHSKILLGGPEVSFDSQVLLSDYCFVDLIIQGEGETKLGKLLEAEDTENIFHQIPGLCFRNQLGGINTNLDEKPILLDRLSFPYAQEDLPKLENKIIYYETMRGCPFSCSYCLSSTIHGVEMLSLKRVFKEIDFFINASVKQVKLVDRTFNCDMKRAKAIFRHLIFRGGKTNFHFEMTGDLIDDEMVRILKEASPGLIQFEIGVQSTDSTTLEAIGRKISLTKTEENVQKLLANKNIHIHLDLIAGLPFETYDIFKTSFNRIIALEPDMLQLGFLKCLKGTRIRFEEQIHEYKYTKFPPYEIISNKYISCDEIYRLRDIEMLVDRYFNSGSFKRTMSYILKKKLFKSSFDFFESFSYFWTTHGYYDAGKSRDQLFEILLEFFKICDLGEQLAEWVKFDFLNLGTMKIPEYMKDTAPEKEWLFDFLKSPANIARYLPEYINLPAKKIFAKVKFQRFSSEFIHHLTGIAISENNSDRLIIFKEKTYQLME